MKIKLIIIVLFAVSCLTSCRKGGCTDPAALNYNSSAKYNDGSCKYFSNQFLGTYTSYDSVYTLEYDSTTQQDTIQYRVYRKGGSFMISRFKSNNVAFTNLGLIGGVYSGPTFNGIPIDSTQFSLLNITFSEYYFTGYFRFSGDTLYYNINYLINNSSIQRCFGFGVNNN